MSRDMTSRARHLFMQVAFFVLGRIPKASRERLRRSWMHTWYLRVMRLLSSGLTEQAFTVGGGPLIGYKFVVDPARWERRYLFGAYEPDIVTVLERFCEPDMTVVDIGAHYGYFSLLMAKLVMPNGRCLAIEAAPLNAAIIRRAIELNQIENLSVHEFAASDFDGAARFAIEQTGFMGHLESDRGVRDDSSYIAVAQYRLDTRIREFGIDRIDLMKIDVEGAEDRVLRGAKQILRDSRPILIVEVHNFESATKFAQPLVRWIIEQGYDVHSIETDTPVDVASFGGGHIIAVPSERGAVTDVTNRVASTSLESS